ncbi:MAG: type II/IV secretion system ATPase subunit [Zestosphaera sp.]
MSLRVLLESLRDRLRGSGKTEGRVRLELGAPSGRELLSYVVGACRVSLITAGEEIVYVAVPRISQDLFRSVGRGLDVVTALMGRGNDLGDVLVEVLGIGRERVAEAIYVLKSVVGYRQLQVLLDDPYILDISVVGPGPVWVRHSWVEQNSHEQDFIRTNIVVNTLDDVVELQQVIATKCGTYISTSNPIVDTQLPPRDGAHRVHLVAHTISTSRRPEIVIRKKLSTPPPVSRLVEEGVLPDAVAKLFRALIRSRGSMIIAGPPGSGKTTLLRSILHSFVPPGWKVAIIEDTGEVDPPPGSSWVRYTTFELGAVKVDLFDLAKAALRASATKLVVVGETRGEEAKVLVQAMLTGLGGLTTFHGASPEEVMTRFTGPPINLSPLQVGMFNFIAVVGYGERPRRQLKRVVELLHLDGDKVGFNVVWDRGRDGMGVDFSTLVPRLGRWGELRARSEAPVEAILSERIE